MNGSLETTTPTSMMLDGSASRITSFLQPRSGSETTPTATVASSAATSDSGRSTPWEVMHRDATEQGSSPISLAESSNPQPPPSPSAGTVEGTTEAHMEALEAVLARTRDFQANVQAILESPASPPSARPSNATQHSPRVSTEPLDLLDFASPHTHSMNNNQWPELVPITLGGQEVARSSLAVSVAYESVDSSGNETDTTTRAQAAETSASEQPLPPNWGSRSTGPSIAPVQNPALPNEPTRRSRTRPLRRLGARLTDWMRAHTPSEASYS